MAYFLSTKTNLGVKGLWLGFATGQVALFILYNTYIYRTDWHKVIADEKALRDACLSSEVGDSERGSVGPGSVGPGSVGPSPRKEEHAQ